MHTHPSLKMSIQTNKSHRTKFCQNVSLCYKRSKVYIDLHTRRAVKIPYSVKICSSVSFGHTFQPHGLCWKLWSIVAHSAHQDQDADPRFIEQGLSCLTCNKEKQKEYICQPQWTCWLTKTNIFIHFSSWALLKTMVNHSTQTKTQKPTESSCGKFWSTSGNIWQNLPHRKVCPEGSSALDKLLQQSYNTKAAMPKLNEICKIKPGCINLGGCLQTKVFWFNQSKELRLQNESCTQVAVEEGFWNAKLQLRQVK